MYSAFMIRDRRFNVLEAAMLGDIIEHVEIDLPNYEPMRRMSERHTPKHPDTKRKSLSAKRR